MRGSAGWECGLLYNVAMKILITAGPTREPIDQVRFIGNRSSGRLGIALAEHAAGMSHNVTLLLGPVGVEPPKQKHLRVMRFESTADLQQLLHEQFASHDVLIMAAAVADYSPVNFSEGKLPRLKDKSQTINIELKPTADLVAGISATKHAGQKIVAFALEEESQLEKRALEKMRRKGVDAIVANPLRTMDAATIEPTVYFADNRPAEKPAGGEVSKRDFAAWLLKCVESMFSV